MGSESQQGRAAGHNAGPGSGHGWRVAAVVVALAGWLLPAFTLTTPVTAPREWRTWELVTEAAGARHGQVWPGDSIANLARLDQQWRGLAGHPEPQTPGSDAGGGWKWRAVEAVPILIVVAAWAAVAAAIALGFRRWNAAMTAAVVGAIAAAYALGVSKVATLLARDELRRALDAARRRFPLAGLLHVQVRGLALNAGPGVVVMLAAFVGLLLLGRGGATRAAQGPSPRA